MAGMVEKKLQELGVVLAEPTTPSANYVPFVRTGNLLTVSGQICYEGGKLVATGKLGAGYRSRTARRRRARVRSTCWRRSKPRSAISIKSCAWCGSAAS